MYCHTFSGRTVCNKEDLFVYIQEDLSELLTNHIYPDDWDTYQGCLMFLPIGVDIEVEQ